MKYKPELTNNFHKPSFFDEQRGIGTMYDDFEDDSIFTPEQVLENRGRVAIFIDGSNLFYAALQLGIEIDYTKLLYRLTEGSRLLRAFFYTGSRSHQRKTAGLFIVDATQWLSCHCQRLSTTP
jgi:hypothetical protein